MQTAKYGKRRTREKIWRDSVQTAPSLQIYDDPFLAAIVKALTGQFKQRLAYLMGVLRNKVMMRITNLFRNTSAVQQWHWAKLEKAF